MKKLLKISLVLIIMVAFSLNLHVFAVEKNKTTDNNSTSTSTTNESTGNETATNESSTQNNSSSTKSSTQVTTVNPTNDAELGISDILNILLIATGVVIILLAIAIFIKLK